MGKEKGKEKGNEKGKEKGKGKGTGKGRWKIALKKLDASTDTQVSSAMHSIGQTKSVSAGMLSRQPSKCRNAIQVHTVPLSALAQIRYKLQIAIVYCQYNELRATKKLVTSAGFLHHKITPSFHHSFAIMSQNLI